MKQKAALLKAAAELAEARAVARVLDATTTSAGSVFVIVSYVA